MGKHATGFAWEKVQWCHSCRESATGVRVRRESGVSKTGLVKIRDYGFVSILSPEGGRRDVRVTGKKQ